MMHMEGRCTSLRAWMLVVTLLGAILVGGCSNFATKPKVTIQPATRTAAPAPLENAPNETAPRLSLSTIVNRDLQNGHYAEGEKALRRYLQDHPDDRSAQFFLRQLTQDPKQMLGAASTPHVVQPGESYSTLAAKYLGDPNLFLVLARYNGSANPALIRLGATLQLPVTQSSAAAAAAAAAATPAPAQLDSDSTPATPVAPTTPVVTNPSQRAQQLESQSIALYRQGHRDQAVALFDQALALNPQLKSSDPDFAALSRVWVANSHQQAMVFYLDQHLDQAIALWNRILVVDPGYEPAVVYRTRALELKQRLQQY
ncbi:LysM domain-containing protein [Dyella humi]|uniref:LysM domain-containing protein n=1 Tax=Dyella humi TaxID=1770547 RepID=UPI0036100F02